MRIGASLLLKDGSCHQSYRWQFLRPLGSLKNAVKILEERQVDEISIIRYCRDIDSDDDFKRDIDLVASLDCMTPLAFGGGIRTSKHLHCLHQLPIERILLSSAYLDRNKSLIQEAICTFGKQALIAVLPYRATSSKIEYYHCRLNSYCSCDSVFINQFSNEILLYNTSNEGLAYSSASTLTQHLPFNTSKVILSGGINRDIINAARKLNYAAVSIDNSALHHEFSFRQL